MTCLISQSWMRLTSQCRGRCPSFTSTISRLCPLPKTATTSITSPKPIQPEPNRASLSSDAHIRLAGGGCWEVPSLYPAGLQLASKPACSIYLAFAYEWRGYCPALNAHEICLEVQSKKFFFSFFPLFNKLINWTALIYRRKTSSALNFVCFVCFPNTVPSIWRVMMRCL